MCMWCYIVFGMYLVSVSLFIHNVINFKRNYLSGPANEKYCCSLTKPNYKAGCSKQPCATVTRDKDTRQEALNGNDGFHLQTG